MPTLQSKPFKKQIRFSIGLLDQSQALADLHQADRIRFCLTHRRDCLERAKSVNRRRQLL